MLQGLYGPHNSFMMKYSSFSRSCPAQSPTSHRVPISCRYSNFMQVSGDVLITKQLNPDKYADPPDVFEGKGNTHWNRCWQNSFLFQPTRPYTPSQCLICGMDACTWSSSGRVQENLMRYLTCFALTMRSVTSSFLGVGTRCYITLTNTAQVKYKTEITNIFSFNLIHHGPSSNRSNNLYKFWGK